MPTVAVARPRDVHGDLAPAVLLAVHLGGGVLGVAVPRERDEPEPARLLRVAVARQEDVLDVAEFPKVLAELRLVGVEVEAADEDFAVLAVVAAAVGRTLGVAHDEEKSAGECLRIGDEERCSERCGGARGGKRGAAESPAQF